MKQTIYADNAATTPLDERVLAEMLPYLKEHYGNPSSVYSIGRTAKKAVETAREQVAAAFGAKLQEIFFTSGGTESDNWAVKGAMAQQKKRGKTHLITTNIEHHAVLHPAQRLEQMGYEVTFLPVNEDGLVTVGQVRDAIRDNTGLVSIMYANNEIGTIQPIREIGALCREKGIWLHTDAVQAVGNLEIDVHEQNIDLMSVSGHKIYGPKGVGALYIRQGIQLAGFSEGGGQERGRRAGTENVAAIVGFGKAIELITQGIPERIQKVSKMRDYLIEHLLQTEKSRLNGSREHRLCGNCNISFEAIEGESLLLMLDLKGICASSGSACTSGSLDPSHVLMAIGLPHEIAHGSLRLTINEHTTQGELDDMIEAIPPVVAQLRAMSPVWDR